MTGFGSARQENDRLRVVAEIKSLNSRYLDINLKFPKTVPQEKELELRSLLKEKLQRGKISVVLDVQAKLNDEPQVKIQGDILKAHYHTLQSIAQDLDAPAPNLYALALSMPDVVNQNLLEEESSDSETQEDWVLLKSAFLEAIEKCESYRQSEGDALGESIVQYAENIHKLLLQVEELDPKRQATIKERIQTRLSEINNNDMFDQNRFEQEMVYYIERLDITEEKVRLKNHLEYFKKTLNSQEANGKKLNFIGQEIGREINTIGSKANDAEIQRIVVDMKDELEKIKEQILNIL